MATTSKRLLLHNTASSTTSSFKFQLQLPVDGPESSRGVGLDLLPDEIHPPH